MKNIQELRDNLTEVFNGLRDGSISPQVATELNNSAGKIISSIKVELEYYGLRKESPEIEFIKQTMK